MKKYITLIPLSVLLLLFLSGCWSTPHQTLDVPDTDIIYQAIDRSEPGEEYINAIGFVNSDGTNNTVIQTRVRAQQPTVSEDGKLIFFREPDQWPFEISPNLGKIGIWNVENGEIKYCSEKLWSRSIVYPLKGTRDFLILLSGTTGYIVNPQDCEIVKEILKVPDNADQEIYFRSPSPSWQGTHIIYAESKIKILDIKTGEVKLIKESGSNPTFSPDGKQIAFIKQDGIFVRNVESAASKQVAVLSIWIGGSEFKPIPFWSPDGEWILYHKCEREEWDCNKREQFSIYKVNVRTLEEVKIVDGGLYPVWRNMLVAPPENSQ
jgi:WD40 repeat protein